MAQPDRAEFIEAAIGICLESNALGKRQIDAVGQQSRLVPFPILCLNQYDLVIHHAPAINAMVVGEGDIGLGRLVGAGRGRSEPGERT